MKKFLSKYNFKYLRTLVYMMQASEYNVNDFFEWYSKVPNFRKVESRKQLVKTLKVQILLCSLAVIMAFGLAIVWVQGDLLSLVIFVVLLPHVLPYLLAGLVYILGAVQKPIERAIVGKAKAKLAIHKGLKIGIAGSFGKTTMKEILRTVLSETRKVAATPENKNTPLGIARFIEKLEGDEEILIFEMGEYYPKDVEELCDLVDPGIGIITGVNEAHLDKFRSLERTAATIFELADFLHKKGHTKLYVNGESRLAKEKAAHFDHILYGSNGIESGEGNWKAEGAETGLAGTGFVLKNNKGDGIVINSKLLGLHQVGPLSVAAHLAKNLGLKTEDIELGIRKTESFEHRLSPREESGGITVIDDSYNGNPDGVWAAINFLKEIKNKRRFYITPGLVEMGQKSEEIHKRIGHELAGAGIEKVVLVKNSVTSFIEVGLKEANFAGEIIWFNNALEAFASLPHRTISNDLLLYQNDWPDNYQ